MGGGTNYPLRSSTVPCLRGIIYVLINKETSHISNLLWGHGMGFARCGRLGMVCVCVCWGEQGEEEEE